MKDLITTPISLCMIVRNEETMLPGCLDSVVGIARELVVVDTGSTDGTPEIARQRGANVFAYPWRDDFAAARNESLRHATGDWILVLDADERIIAEEFAQLQPLMDQPDIIGIDLWLRSKLPPGQPAASLATPYCRLFRNLPGARFRGRIHEQVAPSLRALGGRIVRSRVEILHLGYATPDDAKLTRNRGLLALELEERPDDAFALFNLGLTLESQEKWTEAKGALQRALASQANPLDPTLRAVAWAKLAETALAQGQWTEALTASRHAQEEAGELHIARFTEGRAVFELGDIQGAQEIFAALLEAGPDALGMTLHPYMVAQALGICRLRRGDFMGAAAALARAVANREDGETYFLLGNAYLGLHRLNAATHWYRRAQAAGYPDPNLDKRLVLCETILQQQELG